MMLHVRQMTKTRDGAQPLTGIDPNAHDLSFGPCLLNIG